MAGGLFGLRWDILGFDEYQLRVVKYSGPHNHFKKYFPDYALNNVFFGGEAP